MKEKKKFRDTKFGKFLKKAVEKRGVRAITKIFLPGIGGTVIETIQNATRPEGAEKPHKSNKLQWYIILGVLAVLLYLDVIPLSVLLEYIG